MEIFIKNMVCNRCISSVKSILQKEGQDIKSIELGKVETFQELTSQQLSDLNSALKNEGFEILETSEKQSIEKIKNLLLEVVQSLNIPEDFKISEFLSKKLHKEYSNISKLFSHSENVTLEQYFILLKIEKVKELLFYNEYSLTQIADLLGYKTVQHLSAQFKKVVGLNPTQFLKSRKTHRKPFDQI